MRKSLMSYKRTCVLELRVADKTRGELILALGVKKSLLPFKIWPIWPAAPALSHGIALADMAI